VIGASPSALSGRYIQLNPRNGGAAAGAPAILQSLLGHNSGRDFLQLTHGHGLNVGRPDIRDATRVLVMDQVAGRPVGFVQMVFSQLYNTMSPSQGFAILDSLDDDLPGLDSGALGQVRAALGRAAQDMVGQVTPHVLWWWDDC
jgi:hypothetical protein